MIYHNRQEVERIGPAGSFLDATEDVPCYRFLSSFWLYVEQDDRAFTPHAGSGYWEAWITAWMSREFDRHDLFVDVGANVGYYTLLAATHRIPVIAFEPQKKLVELVKRSLKRNRIDKVMVNRMALSDEFGNLTLVIPEFHSGGAALENGISPAGINFTRETVVVEPFDRIVSVPETDRILVKIDAEGAEPKVIRGMKNTLETHLMTIVLEWESRRWEDPLAFARELEAIGPLSYVNEDSDEVAVTAEQLTAMGTMEMVVVRNAIK